MTFQDFFNDLFNLSMTLGLAVMFENFQNSPCFSTFFDLKQFNRNKFWYPPKCVGVTLLFFVLHYLALSSVATNLHKTMLYLPICIQTTK